MEALGQARPLSTTRVFWNLGEVVKGVGELMGKKCFFCGESNPLVLEEHHIIPQSITDGFVSETVTLCANCHKKLHYLLRPLVKLVKLEAIKENLPDPFPIEENARRVLEVIASYDSKSPGYATEEAVYSDLKAKYGMSDEDISRVLERLIANGVIYCPRPKCYKRSEVW